MKKQPDNNKPLKVAFAGGGSGGPVAPLFAIADAMRSKTETDFLLIGTKNGPERKMAEWNNIPFQGIAAGKLRRYFSFRTFGAPFLSLYGFFQSRSILKGFSAEVFVAAGGFVSVPAGYAAWSLGIPVLIHQQDLVPSISNKLLAPIAHTITVTFQKSLKDFNAQSGLGMPIEKSTNVHETERCVWTGNPVRPEFASVASNVKKDNNEERRVRELFDVASDWPIILIFGGGTGAAGLNAIVEKALAQLLMRFEVIHATGYGKGFDYHDDHYHQYELIENMPEAYAIADLVVCRAGIGTITELAAARKPAIVIPMPDSHQEENALYLNEHDAARIYAQPLMDSERFAKIASALLYDSDAKAILSENIAVIMPKDAAERISSIIFDLCHKKR